MLQLKHESLSPPSILMAPQHGPALKGAEAPEASPDMACVSAAECVVCWDCDASTIFQPCGHLAVCQSCANVFHHQPCPVCRRPVTALIALCT